MSKLIGQATCPSLDGIKAIFFDIDGTIFRANYSISEATVSAFRSLEERGIRTCLATGRPYFGSKGVIGKLSIKSPSMFFSGSFIITPGKETVHSKLSIPRNLAAQLIADLEDAGLYSELYTSDSYFIKRQTELTVIHNTYVHQPPQIGNLRQINEDEEIIKIVAISRTDAEIELARQISKRHEDLYHAFSHGAAHPNLCFLNVTSKQASREAAFEVLLKELNVTAAETVAFGDSDADVPFLQLAGCGIAVANGTEAAKQACDLVCPSVDEDGVVYALKCMGLS